MELADQLQLTALLASSATEVLRHKPRRARDNPASLPLSGPPARKAGKRRCRCGTCAACRDNARWDLIFQSKFADPDYYVRRAIRHESPLGAL